MCSAIHDQPKQSLEKPLLDDKEFKEEVKPSNHKNNLVTMQSTDKVDEAWILLKYSVPVALSSAARTLHDMTNQFILGHLGTEYLAAAGVAGIWTFLFDVIILQSVIQLSTLCSQAFGAGNNKLVGEWLQLGLCCFTLMCVPVILARWFTAEFLEFAGFDSHLAYLAGQYTQYAQMSILFDAVYFSCRAYMSAQGIVRPSMIIDSIAVIVNLVVAYGMVFPMGLGFIGAALATTIVRAIRTVLYILYCFKYQRYHEPTWGGWNAKAVTQTSRWSTLLGLALPAAWGALTEEIQFQLLSFMAARMGQVVIAAHNLSLSMMGIFFVLSSGIGQGVGVRISAAVSSYRVEAAKRTVTVGIRVTLVIGVMFAVAYLILSPLMANAASDDPDVHAALLALAPYVSVCIAALMCLNPVFQILLNQGRSKISANVLAICCWVIGFPISYVYGLKLGGGVCGLWLGLTAGYGSSVVIMIYIISKSDWGKICHDARVRSEVAVSHRSGRE